VFSDGDADEDVKFMAVLVIEGLGGGWHSLSVRVQVYVDKL
jgi:hypothetical protein